MPAAHSSDQLEKWLAEKSAPGRCWNPQATARHLDEKIARNADRQPLGAGAARNRAVGRIADEHKGLTASATAIGSQLTISRGLTIGDASLFVTGPARRRQVALFDIVARTGEDGAEPGNHRSRDPPPKGAARSLNKKLTNASTLTETTTHWIYKLRQIVEADRKGAPRMRTSDSAGKVK